MKISRITVTGKAHKCLLISPLKTVQIRCAYSQDDEKNKREVERGPSPRLDDGVGFFALICIQIVVMDRFAPRDVGEEHGQCLLVSMLQVNRQWQETKFRRKQKKTTFFRGHLKSSHIADKRKNFHMALYPSLPPQTKMWSTMGVMYGRWLCPLSSFFPITCPNNVFCLTQGRFPGGSASIAKWTRRQSCTVEERHDFYFFSQFFCTLKSGRLV